MDDALQANPRLKSYVNVFLLANRLQVVMDRGLRDISSKQWQVLMMLETFPEPPTLKALSQQCGITHQSTMQLVRKLEEKGYVSVMPDAQDRRAVRITATEACHQWTAQYAEQNLWFIQKLFSDLSEEELGLFTATQEKMLERLEEIAEYLKLCL